jgi:hypothetical protein
MINLVGLQAVVRLQRLLAVERIANPPIMSSFQDG